MKLRIVTWNIHKGIGGIDRLYRPERVTEVLKAIQPDIALLQEVAYDLPRARLHHQVELFSRELDMPHVAYGREHRFKKGGYGNAILSHWPLFDVHHIDLTIATLKKRGVLQARCRVRHGRRSRTIVIKNCHLGLSGSERGLQLERLLASRPFKGLHRRTPVVLAGDLNDVWGSLGPRFLGPAGFRRAGKLYATFPAALPLRPLDGIFVRGDAVVKNCQPFLLNGARAASDHLPLVAELELKAL